MPIHQPKMSIFDFGAVLVLAVFFFLASPLSANAYIDPGTGSFLVQVGLAAIFGAALYTKLFWRQIKGFFGRRTAQRSQDDKPKT